VSSELAMLLLSNAILSLLLGGAAWLCDIARRPAFAHLLFALALLKLLTPPCVALPLPPASAPSPPAPSVAGASMPADPVSLLSRFDQAPGGDIEPAAAAAPHHAAVALPEASWSVLLASTWAIGSVAVLALAWTRLRAFRRLVAHARPAPEGLQRSNERLAALCGLGRAPVLAIVDRDLPPLVLATWRGPRLYLPRALLAALSAAQRDGLLLHELAHVRRGDHRMRAFELVATVALWWHPLLWLFRLGLRATEERCCDAWVAALLPDGRRAYCEALVRASQSPAAAVPALASGMGRMGRWRDRLEDIMVRSIPHRLSAGARVLAGALAIAVLPLAIAQEAPVTQRGASLEAPVRVDFEGADLAEWRTLFERATGYPFVVADDLRAIDAARTRLVGVRLPELPARRALDAIAAICDLHWQAVDGVVILSVAAPEVPATVAWDFESGKPGTVTVLGAVRPFSVEVDNETTVLQALSRAQWTERSNLHRVALLRPDPVHPMRIEIDVRKMITTGDTSQNVLLRPGDILFVPGVAAESKPSVAGTGARVSFTFASADLLDSPSTKDLARLTTPQVVDADGRILVPYVGPIPVLGLNEAQITRFVQGLLKSVFHTRIELSAHLQSPQ